MARLLSVPSAAADGAVHDVVWSIKPGAVVDVYVDGRRVNHEGES